MNKLYFQTGLAVAPSSIAGNGVFALRDFNQDEIIEIAPLLLYGEKEDTAFADFRFEYDGKKYLALGFGSCYNHAPNPNVAHQVNPKTLSLELRAKRNIKAKEELCISYGEHWFSERKLPVMVQYHTPHLPWIGWLVLSIILFLIFLYTNPALWASVKHLFM
jgi:hypothetical protein